jgi:hypothetical protein
MGNYVYKVTSNTVELSNGETANVAVYAYKPTYNWNASVSNEQMHFRSGASRCDSYAHTRSEWVVLGYLNKDTGKIEVEIESTAKRIGQRGSFNDGWYDMKEAESSAVAATLDRKVQLMRTVREEHTATSGEDVSYAYDRKKGWQEVARRAWSCGVAV